MGGKMSDSLEHTVIWYVRVDDETRADPDLGR